MQWLLRVLHVADSSLPTGETFVVGEDTLLGRAPDTTVRLDHASISRHHLRWRVVTHPDTIELLNLSRHSAVFVDGASLAPGGTWRGAAPARLQLGAILFEVTGIAATEPYAHRIEPAPGREAAVEPAPEHPAIDPIFEILQDGDATAVRCRGRFVDLPPAACRLFARLARQSSAVVHRWDLQDAVGPGGNLAQLTTLIRRGVRDLVEAGVIDPGELREMIRAASGSGRVEDLDSLDLETLLRRLVLSRRGHGYVLCIPPARLRFVEADD